MCCVCGGQGGGGLCLKYSPLQNSGIVSLVMSAVLIFRYHYGCVIYGWDPVCRMNEAWIQRMGVDHSPGGRNQPFYNVLGDDGSQRYAAHGKYGILNLIGVYVAKHYLNLKAAVDVQITALFLNWLPTMT